MHKMPISSSNPIHPSILTHTPSQTPYCCYLPPVPNCINPLPTVPTKAKEQLLPGGAWL